MKRPGRVAGQYFPRGSRDKTPYLMLFLLVAFSAIDLDAQVSSKLIENQNILAPEVTHFTRIQQPGVDSHGDLNLSVPLMTVPGRDGLDFDLVAQYNSGIQVTQSASWIGLGWSLDVGSLTRHAMGGLQGKDQADFAKVRVQSTPDLDSQPDVYVASMNGNSTRLVSLTPETMTTSPVFPYDPAASTTGSLPCDYGLEFSKVFFTPSPWKPWKICYGIPDNQGSPAPVNVDGHLSSDPDFSEFIITTEDGTSYVYALPTLSEVFMPKVGPFTDLELTKYVSTWRLRAILAPNYSGPMIPVGGGEDSFGGWIRIDYRTWDDDPATPENDATALEVFTISNSSVRFFQQTTYPFQIVTPTHIAEFETSVRYDADLALLVSPGTIYESSINRFFSRKLDSITLYKKNLDDSRGPPITEVLFTYLNNSALTKADDNIMMSKLALSTIQIKGLGGTAGEKSLPPYEFDYNKGDLSWQTIIGDGSKVIPLHHQDDFGYLSSNPLGGVPSDPDSEGPMWSLTEIAYPEGGRQVISYESDQFVDPAQAITFRQLSQSLQGLNTWAEVTDGEFLVGNRQGGPRVKSIKTYDGFNDDNPADPNDSDDPDVFVYTYGPGHYSGLSDIWFRKQHSIRQEPLYFSSERGQFNITYEWVRKVLPDGSSIKTHYYAGTDTNGSHTREPQLFYINDSNSMANLHENRTWNWGEILKIELLDQSQIPVKEEIFDWYFEGHDSAVGFLQLAWVSGGLPAPPEQSDNIYLNFTIKLLRSKTTNFYFGSTANAVTIEEEFVNYNDGALLEEKKETISLDGTVKQVRTTQINYAHDIPSFANSPYSDMADQNMRSQVAQVSTFDDNGNGYAAQVTTWEKVAHTVSPAEYLPDKEFQWRDNLPGSIPQFQWQSQSGTNWIKTKEFVNYDEHGNPTEIANADASQALIGWEASSASSLIDFIVEKPTGDIADNLTTNYNYDPNTFKLTQILDPNVNSTDFMYDPLQRLDTVFVADGTPGDGGSLQTQFAYNFSRGTFPGSVFVEANPNYVETTNHFGTGLAQTTRAYADGLGRDIQTQENFGNASIKSASFYDRLGHIVKVTKPFDSATQSFSLPTNVLTEAITDYADLAPYYPTSAADVGNFPFSETTYLPDPLDRIEQQSAPGTEFHLGSGRLVSFNYAANTLADGIGGYAANTLFKEIRTDENGHTVETFTDGFGNTIATVVEQAPGQPKLKTLFSYDIVGNLIQSITPEGLVTTYQYNTLNQLISKTSPDAGTVDFKYDMNGNRRFVKDANGNFTYMKYDNLNRKIEEGLITDSNAFVQSKADSPAYPVLDVLTDPNYEPTARFTAKFDFDATNYSTNLLQENLKGRLAAVHYDPVQDFGATDAIEFYSYDERGNIKAVEKWIPFAQNKQIRVLTRYQYDLQNNTTKVSFARSVWPDPESDLQYVWYAYDELGRLVDVFTNSTDAKPAVPDAHYTYLPTGQVERLELGGGIQGIDHLYNSRDWATQINHPDLVPSTDPGSDGSGGLTYFYRLTAVDEVNQESAYSNEAVSKFVGATPPAAPAIKGEIESNPKAPTRRVEGNHSEGRIQ